jgi:multidrug efflux pump subunit AcrA (membrane-fusion protein)
MLLAGQQQMLAMQNRAASTAETQQREVTSLRQQLDALRTERRDTRSGELLALTDRYATLAAELDRTRREMAALQVRAAEPPVEPPRRPAYVPPLEAAPERALPPDTTVVLSIVPYGRDQAIQWRLPVPEE